MNKRKPEIGGGAGEGSHKHLGGFGERDKVSLGAYFPSGWDLVVCVREGMSEGVREQSAAERVSRVSGASEQT